MQSKLLKGKNEKLESNVTVSGSTTNGSAQRGENFSYLFVISYSHVCYEQKYYFGLILIFRNEFIVCIFLCLKHLKGM